MTEISEMDGFSCYLIYLTADREAETFFNSDWSSFGKEVAAAHFPHVSLYGKAGMVICSL